MKNFVLFCMLVLTIPFVSCSKDEEINEYSAGVFEEERGTINENAIIRESYLSAFNYMGLVDGKGMRYMYSPSREKVLYACSVAEKTIKDANVDFKGFYVFELRENGKRIYCITFGQKKLPSTE